MRENPQRAGKLAERLRAAGPWPETVHKRLFAVIFATLLERVEEQVAEARKRAGEDLSRRVDAYAHGVWVGQAQPLEDYTDALADAFEPVRETFRRWYGNTIKLYRAEPKRPPKLPRAFLSWTPRKKLAEQFLVRGSHVVAADVAIEDIVFGITSERNRGYIEYLVRDRPAYHVPAAS